MLERIETCEQFKKYKKIINYIGALTSKLFKAKK